jgi:hypothetical protein
MIQLRREHHLPRLTSTESTLDMVFLHSDPILIEVEFKDQVTKRLRKELVDFNEPLETELEFEGIT